MRFLSRSFLMLGIILTQCGWIGYGGAGWQNPILDVGYYSTTNQTLTSAQSGQILVTTNTLTNNTNIYLPTATVGLNFTFIAGTTKYIVLTPQSTDTIVFASKTSGQTLSNAGSSAIGDSITIVCVQNTQWQIAAKSGTWA